MPHMFLELPRGEFSGSARKVLVTRLIDAAAAAERIPPGPAQRAFCWLTITEIDPADWTVGGHDASVRLLTCALRVRVPAGVLNTAARAQQVRLLDAALRESLPPDETRRLVTSIILDEVPDGYWAIDGELWALPRFAAAAGFEHLQHLVQRVVP